MLKNLPFERVEALKKTLRLTPGATDLVKELKKAGFMVAIITGGFDVFAKYVGAKLGVDYVYANKLKVRDGVLTGEFIGKITSPRAKLEALMEIAKKEGINLGECVAVGDGANDIFILKNSGLGIGYKPKKRVGEQVRALINAKDLRVAIALVGLGQPSRDVRRKLKSKI